MSEPQEIRVVISATAAQLREALRGAKGDLGDLSAQIREVPNSIKVDVDARTAAAEQRLRALRDIAKEAGKNINIRADADTGVAEAKLRLLERQARQTEEAIAKAQLGGLVSGGAGGAGHAGSSVLSGGLPGGLGLVGVAVAAPAIAALVGSLTALAGSLGAATLGFGALGTAAAGVGAVGIGAMLAVLIPAKKAITDVMTAQDALQQAQNKYGANSKQAATAQKGLNAVMDEAGPAASKAALELGKLKDQWTDLSQGAQNSLFTKILTPALKTLETLLPTVAKIAKQSFDAIGQALEPVFRGLSSPAFRRVLVELGDAFARLAGPLIGGFSNLMRAFFNVAVAAAPFVQQIAVAFERWSGSFAASLAPGKHLNDLIGGLVGHLHSWWELAKAVGEIMITIFKAGADTGKGLVDQLTHVVDKWDAWLNTSAGQERLHTFFTESADLLRAVARTLAAIAPLLASMAVGLIPTFTTLLRPAAELLTTISHWVNDLSKGLPPVLSALPGLALTVGVLAGWKLLRDLTGQALRNMLGLKTPGGGIFSGGAAGIEGVHGPGAPGSLANPIAVTGVGGGGGGGKVPGAGAITGEGAAAGGLAAGGEATAATVTGGLGLATVIATALPAAMVALAIFDRKDFPTGGNQGQPEWTHNTTQDIFGAGQVARNLRVFGGGNGADSGFGQFSTGAALGATGAGARGETGIKAFLTQLATQGTKVKEFNADIAKTGMALGNLASHDVSISQTIGVLNRLAAQAKGLGDTKMQFADKLGAEMLKSKGNISQGVQNLLREVDKLPPGLARRAVDGMVQMAHQLHDKGLLSQQAMDNLLVDIDTHTKAGMLRVQTQAKTAMESVFGSVSSNTSKAKTAAAKNIGALATSTGNSLTQAAGTAKTQTDHMHSDVASNTDKTHKDGAANIGALAKNIGGLLTGAAGATHTGIGNIGDQIAKALSSLGAGKFSIATVSAATNLASQAVAGVFGKAGGGYIGSPGEKGPDAVPIVVGRGEAVLNHAQQGVVNAALSAAGIGGLPQLFSQVTTPHYMARGGFAGGGVAGGGNALQGAGSQTAGYVYPVPGLAVERTDMGKDFGGAGPIGAIGPGVVVGGDWGWYPGEGSGLVYRLTAGPRAGMNVYVQEDIHPLVGMGAVLTPGEIIAQAWGGPHGIEMGWANASATGPLTPYNGAGDGTPMPGGIDFANFVLGLAHGQLVGSGLGGAVAIPQINLPEVKGGGVTGKMVKSGLQKIVDAANKYVQAHAPTSTGSASGVGAVIPGDAPPGALQWEVKAVEESTDLKENSGGGAYGPLIGYSELGNPLGGAIGNALGHLPGMTEMWISANHKTVKAPLVDIGSGSQGPEWSSFPALVMGMYPQTYEALGFAPLTSPWLVDIGRVDGQPLHPASGIPVNTAGARPHALGGFAGLMEHFANGGRVAHSAYGSSTSTAAKTKAKPKAPAKPKHAKPPKLPKLPTLKGLPGFDQTLLNQIDTTDIAAGELGNWLGYLDGLHSSIPVSTTITKADGTQAINWGDPKSTLGHLTGLVDPATGQQTKSIWDRIREIGDPATASRLPPHHRGGAGTGPPTELGTEAAILQDLLSEQGLAGQANKAYGKWLPAMTSDIADGKHQIDWLTAATDTTTPWSKLGKVDFRSIYPMGNLRTTTGQIYQYTTDAQGNPHFKFQGNDMGPEIKKRAHEYKNLLARIEYETERKEKLPKERRDREKAIRDRFDKARHNIDIASLTSTFDARQLVNDQLAGLTGEEQAIAATIPTSPPNSWKGDLRAWQEQHKLERLTVKEEFDHRKQSLRDLAAKGGLQGRINKSNALFGLRLGERAELTALTDLFGDKDVKLKDELRSNKTTRDADKKWLGGWLSKIKGTHTSEETALTAATEARGFGDRLKAFVDPMGALSLSVLQKQTIDIPALLREIATLKGTTLPGTPAAPGGVDQSALNALLTQQLQTTQQALALSQAQFGVFKGFEPLVEQRLVGTFASGIDFVPKTGLAIVHRGETITPDPGGPYGNRATATVHTADQPMELVLVMANDEKPMMRLIDARLNQKSLQIVSDRSGQRARLMAGVRRP